MGIILIFIGMWILYLIECFLRYNVLVLFILEWIIIYLKYIERIMWFVVYCRYGKDFRECIKLVRLYVYVYFKKYEEGY